MKVKSPVFIWRQAPIGPTIVNRQTNRAGLVNYLKVRSKVKTLVKKLTLILQA